MSRAKLQLAIRPEPAAAVPASAMVLAAGLGKRMRPLTATRPKPLVEVAGRSLLDHTLDRLRAAGVRHAVVNVHYLPDALEAHVRNRVKGIEVSISDERDMLLETGGGLARALPLIRSDPFLSVNSDNLWVDGPSDTLRLIASHWDGKRMDALLLMVPLARANCHSGQGDFHLSASGAVRRKKPGAVAPFVYTGIQILSKRLFEGAPDGAFSMNLLWDKAIKAGRCFGAVHQGLWFDVGTAAAVARTQEILGAA
jgi:MurNAc alpha-1-phosphate uridylyltransferase